MIKNIIKICSLGILAFILTDCDNHEFPKTPYPNVRTSPVTNISASGATFTGEVSNSENSSIISHGFVWTVWKNNNPEIGPNDSVELGNLMGDDTFYYHLNKTLNGSQEYYVRAFVKTKDYIVFGEEVSFKSK